MAKQALLQRELKRDMLAKKFAKKYAELKAVANNAKLSDEERDAARLGLQKLPRNANPTRQRNRCGITVCSEIELMVVITSLILVAFSCNVVTESEVCSI